MLAVAVALGLAWALHALAVRHPRQAAAAARLGRHLPAAWLAGARQRLQAAGHARCDPALWLARRGLLALLAAAVSYALGAWQPDLLPPPALAIMAGAAGWLGPGEALRREAERRRRRLTADLPRLLDLLALAVSGGLGLHAALAEAGALAPAGPLAAELDWVGCHVALGAAPEATLERLAERTGVPVLTALAAAVAQARWLGTPLEQVLWEQAAALRLELRHEQAERLGTMPLKLSLVTIAFFVPPLFLLVFLPGLLPLLGGG